jgi:acid phosphatase (class A)
MSYMMKSRSALFAVVALLTYAVLSAGCASPGGPGQAAAVPEIRPGVLAGYLPPTGLPNSLALVPPPPAAGSAAFASDEEASRKALALRGTPRWKLATEDADLAFPQAAGTFSCAVNAPITEQETPHLYMLMRRASTDAGRSTSAAEDYYNRPRPFMANKEPICTPDDEGFLVKNGSYPSGHSAIG